METLGVDARGEQLDAAAGAEERHQALAHVARHHRDGGGGASETPQEESPRRNPRGRKLQAVRAGHVGHTVSLSQVAPISASGAAAPKSTTSGRSSITRREAAASTAGVGKSMRVGCRTTRCGNVASKAAAPGYVDASTVTEPGSSRRTS